MTNRFFSCSLKVFFIAVLSAAMLLIPDNSDADSTSAPFAPGEKLTYRITWFSLPAAEASLEVLPIKTVNGVEAFHFQLTANTFPVVESVFKFRNQIHAFADMDLSRSLLYQKTRKDGNKSNLVQVEFDWKKQQARYIKRGKKKSPIPISPQTLDPLSILYFTRFQELSENAVVQRSVTDGKKCFLGRARVIRKETVNLEMGSFESFLIEPDQSTLKRAFEKTPDARLKVWITADEYRIPVKIQSQLALGQFEAELISVEHGATAAEKTHETAGHAAFIPSL